MKRLIADQGALLVGPGAAGSYLLAGWQGFACFAVGIALMFAVTWCKLVRGPR